MPVKKKIERTREVHVLVGTHKGGFRFRSDLRRRSWKVDAPFFAGAEVNHLTRDPRKGHLWAATHTAWWGSDLQVSRNGGKTWRKSCEGLSFASDRGLTLNRIWQVVPDRPSRPETMWCGVDPGALFRSDDGGRNWYEVEGLNRHRTRDRWQPGGGGLMVHGIFPDPARENRIYVALSAAGCFRSDDDGRTWLPRNKDVLADCPAQALPRGRPVRPPHGDEPAKSRPALSAEPLRRLSQPQRRRGLGRHQRRAALALRLSHGRASARAGDPFRRARGRPGGALRLRRPAYSVSHQERRQGVAKTHPRPAAEECLHSGPAPRHADRYLRQPLQSISEPPAESFTTRSTTATPGSSFRPTCLGFIRWKRQ